jgi:hypothetical protein
LILPAVARFHLYTSFFVSVSAALG